LHIIFVSSIQHSAWNETHINGHTHNFFLLVLNDNKGDETVTTKLHATAQLIHGFQIALDDGRSHSAMVDQPVTAEGTDLGPTPLELCVMSHAGCYATVLVLVAQRMRIALHGLTVKVAAVKTDEAGTITEETFDIAIKADAPQDRI
jgi:uncharacterized OsmC-like protein